MRRHLNTLALLAIGMLLCAWLPLAAQAPRDGGRTGIFVPSSNSGGGLQGLETAMRSVAQRLDGALRELGRPEPDPARFRLHLEQRLAPAVEATAEMLKEAAAGLAEAEAALHLGITKLLLARAELRSEARQALAEPLKQLRERLSMVRLLHEALVESMKPFGSLVEELETLVAVAKIEASTAVVLQRVSRLPSSDDVRTLQQSFVTLLGLLRELPRTPVEIPHRDALERLQQSSQLSTGGYR